MTDPRSLPQATPAASLASFDGISWEQFEDLVAAAFRVHGYQVTKTRSGADGGVDLILTHDGQRAYVQCKHWNVYQVGVKVVRELRGVMASHQVTAGFMVTSGTFTQEARTFAQQNGIQLLEGQQTLNWINQAGVVPAALNRTQPHAPWAQAEPMGAGGGSLPSPRCPKCGEFMAYRLARRGPNKGRPFWGCPRYPTCRGMLTISASPPAQAPPAATIGYHPAAAAFPPPQLPARTPRGPHASSRATRALLKVAVATITFVVMLTVALLLPSLIRSAATPNILHLPSALPSAVDPTDPGSATTIPVGARPQALALNPKTHTLYVANFADGTISVIDTNSRTATGTIKTPGQPSGVALHSGDRTLYVTGYDTGKVSVISIKTGRTLATIGVGKRPSAIAIDSTARRAYVANSGSPAVTIIDTRSRRKVGTIELGFAPGGLAVDPVKERLYVLETQLGFLRGINTTNRRSASTTLVGGSGLGVAVDTRTHDVFVTSTRGQLIPIDTFTGRRGTAIDIGGSPYGVAIDHAARVAYVAQYDDNSIAVLDIE